MAAQFKPNGLWQCRRGSGRAIAGDLTARRAITRNAIDSFSEIATVRVDLKESDPPIWRAVEVPTSITLKVLHDIVQMTMRWLGYHLWEMVIGSETYGLPTDEDCGTAPRR